MSSFSRECPPELSTTVNGRTDAQNEQEVFFGEEQLLEIVQANMDMQADPNLPTGREFSAQGVQEALTAEIHRFVNGAPQFDDITMMIIVRES